MAQSNYKCRSSLTSQSPGRLPPSELSMKIDEPLAQPNVDEPMVNLVGPARRVQADADGLRECRVLIHYKNNIQKVLQSGLKLTSYVGLRTGDGIVAGFATQEVLEKLTDIEEVVSYEYSSFMKHELADSVPELGVPELRRKLKALGSNISGKGAGVIVAVIDSSFDYTHPTFCEFDGNKHSTRILALWDQKAANNLDGRTGNHQDQKNIHVGLMPYGVEYTEDEINIALNSPNPFAIVPHTPATLWEKHGTHVAAIAGGNGSAGGNEKFEGKYVGVAPKAHLIFVSFNEEEQLGDSANFVDALCYIVQKAKEKEMPVVINISYGDEFGPHDGTSLLEKAIDMILEIPGVAIVKSAGNARASCRHTSGKLSRDTESSLMFDVPLNAYEEALFDVWYDGKSRFDVCVENPHHERTAWVSPDNSLKQAVSFSLTTGNTIEIESKVNDPENGDNRITIRLRKGSSNQIEEDRWSIIIKATEVENEKSGIFHAWVDSKDQEISAFLPKFVNPSQNCTITIPGTSKKIITVGEYGVSDSNKRQLMLGSSLGPTRDGTPKPELVAPGFRITSASVCKNNYQLDTLYEAMAGTSVAAPHIAGVIALLFEKDKTLTQDEIRKILLNSSSPVTASDPYNGPDINSWGHGKLDASKIV